MFIFLNKGITETREPKTFSVINTCIYEMLPTSHGVGRIGQQHTLPKVNKQACTISARKEESDLRWTPSYPKHHFPRTGDARLQHTVVLGTSHLKKSIWHFSTVRLVRVTYSE
jgi:hypothetical protein